MVDGDTLGFAPEDATQSGEDTDDVPELYFSDSEEEMEELQDEAVDEDTRVLIFFVSR